MSTIQAGPVAERRTGHYVDDVLGYLDSINFWAPGWFIWTHHNYEDMEKGLTGIYSRAAYTRSRLLGSRMQYAYTNNGSSGPSLWMTEGGTRFDVVRQRYFTDLGISPTLEQVETKMAQLMQTNFDSMVNEAAQGRRHRDARPVPDVQRPRLRLRSVGPLYGGPAQAAVVRQVGELP
jgi:hypothetical protein